MMAIVFLNVGYHKDIILCFTKKVSYSQNVILKSVT